MDPELTELLAGYPVVIDIPVWWGDQDAFQHVNNTVYLRWYESSRIAYHRTIGLSDLMTTGNVGPILASISCEYRYPLTFPDTVRVGARITRLGRTSMTMEHRVVSQAAQRVAADGSSAIVL